MNLALACFAVCVGHFGALVMLLMLKYWPFSLSWVLLVSGVLFGSSICRSLWMWSLFCRRFLGLVLVVWLGCRSTWRFLGMLFVCRIVGRIRFLLGCR